MKTLETASLRFDQIVIDQSISELTSNLLIDLTQKESKLTIDRTNGDFDMSRVIIVFESGKWQRLNEVIATTKTLPKKFYLVNNNHPLTTSKEYVCIGCSCKGSACECIACYEK